MVTKRGRAVAGNRRQASQATHAGIRERACRTSGRSSLSQRRNFATSNHVAGCFLPTFQATWWLPSARSASTRRPPCETTTESCPAATSARATSIVPCSTPPPSRAGRTWTTFNAAASVHSSFDNAKDVGCECSGVCRADTIARMTTRRQLLASAVTGTALAVSAWTWRQQALARQAGLPRQVGLPQLLPTADQTTGESLLLLPPDFTYKSFSWSLESTDDGNVVSGLHDGMGAFPSADGRTVTLVRNHEITLAPLLAQAPAYDPHCGGGTTTLTFDLEAGQWQNSRVSLAGTYKNCSGGPTPWGSWLTCEETLADPSTHAVARRHGYVFEVPADGIGDPKPLTALGRFKHEAAAVDPATGIVYLTEDERRAGLYRFVPRESRCGRSQPARPGSPANVGDRGTLELHRPVAGRGHLAHGLGGHRRPARSGRCVGIRAGLAARWHALQTPRRLLVGRRPAVLRLHYRRRGGQGSDLGACRRHRPLDAPLRVAGARNAGHAGQPGEHAWRRSTALRGWWVTDSPSALGRNRRRDHRRRKRRGARWPERLQRRTFAAANGAACAVLATGCS